jgi:F0F1-type ATP synthase assembly protein I
MRYAVFNIRARSLLRGTVLVVGSVVLALVWSGFPNNVHGSLLVAVPACLAVYGTWETSRCLRPRWSFYHGGVLLLLYADVLALALIVFLLLYPYARWLQGL